MEGIKRGTVTLLPHLCEEILERTKLNEEYATCHHVLAGLSRWAPHVSHWLHVGCMKIEPYQSSSWVQPCPSHVICSQITDLQREPFCDEVTSDYAPDNKKAAPGTPPPPSPPGTPPAPAPNTPPAPPP